MITRYNDMIVSDNNHIRFGIDASGNYGYKKVGADTVTPFKSYQTTLVTKRGSTTFTATVGTIYLVILVGLTGNTDIDNKEVTIYSGAAIIHQYRIAASGGCTHSGVTFRGNAGMVLIKATSTTVSINSIGFDTMLVYE